MSDAPRYLELRGRDGAVRRIAYLKEAGGTTPGVVWLGGFKSEMTGTKAGALAEWGAREDVPVLRFDYSGHGASSGDFTEGTIGRWLEDSLAVLQQAAEGPQILVGSSMGGWIALLILRAIARGEAAAADLPPVRGAVLIAPAWDMTEELFQKGFTEEARAALERDGVYHRPSPYGDGPYPITRRLIEEGREHLIGATPFTPPCPVRILQGEQDPDVPWQHAERLAALLGDGDVETVFVPDGDHRLSRPQDIETLLEMIAELRGEVGADQSRSRTSARKPSR
jgi:pimeloyl-ACP methyl ester carboxylesterase